MLMVYRCFASQYLYLRQLFTLRSIVQEKHDDQFTFCTLFNPGMGRTPDIECEMAIRFAYIFYHFLASAKVTGCRHKKESVILSLSLVIVHIHS